MPTVMVTFVHISNISAVTGPILTKLFWPNFFGVIIFVDQNVHGQNFFGPKCFLNITFFSRPKFCYASKFVDQKYHWTQQNFQTQFFLDLKFFGPKIFLSDPEFFCTQNFSTLFQIKIFFWTHYFFQKKFPDPKFILPPNFFWIFFWTKNVFPDQKSF